MPIQKVEKTYKFGILSTSYRVSLQERLLRDFKEQQRQRLVEATAKESPCRVRSAFVRSFNQERNEVSKLELKKKAYTLVERIKRLVGLTTNGEGDFVDTALGWRECIQLAQCEDRDIINASLDVMWISLEQTPLSDLLVPVCFDVAEIILYWICNRTSRQQAISSTELRMLQIGRLIFLRLYFYHMTCKIAQEAHAEFRLRLAYQLNGFDTIVQIYQNYPDAWFCARVIDHVGKMITDGLSLSMSNTDLSEIAEVNSADVKVDRKQSGKSAVIAQEDTVPVTKAITEGVHALSPSLWHALDVFRAVETKHYSGAEDLQHALLGLVECDIMTKVENWLDCACAIHLLSNAAHRDIEVLQTVTRLFMSNQENRKLWHKWTNSKCGGQFNSSPRSTQSLFQSLPAELMISYAFLLIDVCLRSHDILIQRFALMGDRATPDPLESGTSCPTASLADLLVLQLPDSENEWRIRYVTAVGLMLIRRCFGDDSLRNGLSIAADMLLKSSPALGSSTYCRGQQTPARQLGTTDWLTAATLVNPWYYVAVLPGVTSSRFISLACRLGRSLTKHYLPSRSEKLLADDTFVRSLSSVSGETVTKSGRKQSTVAEKCERKKQITSLSQKGDSLQSKSSSQKVDKLERVAKDSQTNNIHPRRPGISDECLLRDGFDVKGAAFEDRARNDLKNVIEDQWMKELHASLDAELAKS